jgi:hypothetical protein
MSWNTGTTDLPEKAKRQSVKPACRLDGSLLAVSAA